ncbi:MAG: LPS-assembly protein LptD [Terriglobia bacterium]
MRTLRVILPLALVATAWAPPLAGQAQRPASPPPSADIVEIRADHQEKKGEVYYLQGNVEIHYRGSTLTADDVTYDEENRLVEARGHVVFEREDDRIEAEEARYYLDTGEGLFLQVVGTVGAPALPTNAQLVSTNPFYFEAQEVERRSDGSYLARDGWVTNCQPGRPKWRLKAARAKIRPGQDVRLHRSTFVVGGVPILYSPFTSISIADKPRQTGFLFPSFGNDSRRGTNFGTAFFWAINPHADLTVGGEFFNQGGWTFSSEFRALPSASSTINVTYFAAFADKLKRTRRRRSNIGINQSGQFAHIEASTRLPHGFRTLVDISLLTSFRFRQGFAETFNEAVRSEVRANGFLTNNPDTLYFNAFFARYENFFRARPETSITLINAPAVAFGTRPRWLEWLNGRPVYFSFDAEVGGMRREEPRFKTPELVQRYSLYPRVSLPFQLGRYFRLTPTFGVRASRYSSRVVDDASQPGGKRVLNRPLRRFTEEVSVDLRFPSFQRIFERSQHRYKHVIEPEVTYRYVNGVRSFEQFLRFDDRDTLTDTHEVEYALTQRLYFKEKDESGHVQELLSWRLSQKYYLDPDFRGALRPGVRNVFIALNSVTPFAFADEPRRFSPLASTIRFTPRGRYSADFRLDYDTKKDKVVNTRLSASARLLRLVRFVAAHYTTRNDEVLQPRSNQVRFFAAYGTLNRPGFNAAYGTTWDIRRGFLPNSIAQASYNWDCCGVAFSFRKIGLGAVRSDNEYRFAFSIANVGTFGTIRRRERIF